jgi:hypothetical protein
MKLGFSSLLSKNKTENTSHRTNDSQLKEIARRFNKDIGGFNETEEYVGEDGSCVPVPYDVEPEDVIQPDERRSKLSGAGYVYSPQTLSLPTGNIPSSWTTSACLLTASSYTTPSYVSTSVYSSRVSSNVSGSYYNDQVKAKDPNSVEYDICIVRDGDVVQKNPQIHAGYCNVEIIRK